MEIILSAIILFYFLISGPPELVSHLSVCVVEAVYRRYDHGDVGHSVPELGNERGQLVVRLTPVNTGRPGPPHSQTL